MPDLLYCVSCVLAQVCTWEQLTCAPHVACFEISIWEFYLLGFHVPIYLLLEREAQNYVLFSRGFAYSFWLWHEQFSLVHREHSVVSTKLEAWRSGLRNDYSISSRMGTVQWQQSIVMLDPGHLFLIAHAGFQTQMYHEPQVPRPCLRNCAKSSKGSWREGIWTSLASTVILTDALSTWVENIFPGCSDV